jgi:hypothetical protein
VTIALPMMALLLVPAPGLAPDNRRRRPHRCLSSWPRGIPLPNCINLMIYWVVKLMQFGFGVPELRLREPDVRCQRGWLGRT